MRCAARNSAASSTRPARGRGELRGWLGVAAVTLGLALGTLTTSASAEPPPSNPSAPSIEQIAERLLGATVTVRIATSKPVAAAKPAPADKPNPSPAASGATAPTAKSAAPLPTRQKANAPPPAKSAGSNPANAATVSVEASSTAPAHEGTGAAQAAEKAPFAPDAATAKKTPRDLQKRARIPFNNPALLSAVRNNLGTQVSVCSGVSLGGGLIVTFSRTPQPAQFRITLSDGQQARASLIVQDFYSGLCLLQTDTQGLPVMTLADSPPAIGAWLMTAAGAGIDRPLVSQGIVGGIERMPRGSNLPPLLQCDLRTAETSLGSPVVDRQGKLVGIVAAVSAKPEEEGDAQAGWTFVVPAKYIARLVAARLDGGVVVLQRQRPSLGLTLVPGQEETVVVERVERGGPAHLAGIREGDLVVEVDGRKIRSPLQVVSLVDRKQPGEKMAFILLTAAGEATQAMVTLSTALPDVNPPANPSSNLIEPQTGARVTPQNAVEVSRPGQPAAPAKASPGAPATGDQAWLDKVSGFEDEIAGLRALLEDRDRTLTQTSEQLERLTAELERLRREQEAAKVPSGD